MWLVDSQCGIVGILLNFHMWTGVKNFRPECGVKFFIHEIGVNFLSGMFNLVPHVKFLICIHIKHVSGVIQVWNRPDLMRIFCTGWLLQGIPPSTNKLLQSFLKADNNGKLSPYFIFIEPLSKTRDKLGSCHVWFHLHGLARAARSTQHMRIYKNKTNHRHIHTSTIHNEKKNLVYSEVEHGNFRLWSRRANDCTTISYTCTCIYRAFKSRPHFTWVCYEKDTYKGITIILTLYGQQTSI